MRYPQLTAVFSSFSQFQVALW